MTDDLPEHVQRNRGYWDEKAAEYEAPGRRAWASDEPSWGVFGVPEATLHVLPDDLAGLDVIELGCGAGLVVRNAICVVDREEGGADELARHGVRLRCLYRVSDLVDSVKTAGKPHG